MTVKKPPGIAKFDSASAMTQALGRFLHGQDFSGLGQSPFMQFVARRADLLPAGLRRKVFARLGASEGIAAAEIAKADAEHVARWMSSQYPQRRYPAIAIGSSNGALNHLYAAMGIPWLAQTFLLLIEQTHVDPDDPEHAMRAEVETARRFLENNPGVQLHHLHDPNQDRLMIQLITYYRAKYIRLPSAYRRFIENCLAPDGTLYLVECRKSWPTKRVADRHVFQFGAIGGATLEDYFRSGKAVEEQLRRHGSDRRGWTPPEPDGESPEAEWGFATDLREEIVEFARLRGHRVVRLCFEEPEQPSAAVADFHRRWYRERGISGARLFIESFVVHDPHWALRTGSVPLWMVFNMQPSLDLVNRYLDERADDPYDEILLALFAHGAEAVGLPAIEDWQRLVERARARGAMLGIDPSTYPAHFAHFGRYSQALQREVEERHPLPPPVPLDQIEALFEEGAGDGLELEVAHGHGSS